MRKVMFLLTVIAVFILMFAPVATARKNSSTASSTSMSSASASASSASSSGTAAAAGKEVGKKAGLPKTGGPEPMALLAGVVLVGSGVAARAYTRRRETT